MKPGGSSKKGGGFERKILKELSLWISEGKRADLFRRSMMSGGRATISLKEGKDDYIEQIGDTSLARVDATAIRFQEVMLTEYKFYKDLRVDQLIWGSFAKGKSIVPFWIKLCEIATSIGKQPFLVAKQNRKPEILLLKRETLYFFNHEGRALATIYPGSEGRYFDAPIHIFDFYSFLESVKFDPEKD